MKEKDSVIRSLQSLKAAIRAFIAAGENVIGEIEDLENRLQEFNTEKVVPKEQHEEEGAKLLNKRQIGEYLQCSQRQIDYLREQGLPFICLGGRIRFDLDNVKQWVKNREVQNKKVND